VDPQNYKILRLLVHLSVIGYTMASAWSKTAFAFTLLRLATGRTRGFLWFTIISVNILMGFNAIFTWVQCQPIQKLWQENIPGRCLDQQAIVIGVFMGCKYWIFGNLYWSRFNHP
jgi:hypothetical protein